MKLQSPPRFLVRVLHWFCREDRLEEIEGDLSELFFERVTNAGVRKARWYFAWNVLKAFQLSNLKNLIPMKTSKGLLSNYLITSIRSLQRNKSYALINFLGLTLGLSSILIAVVAILHELSYDRQFTDPDTIYRIVLNVKNENETRYVSNVPYPLPAAVAGNILGIDQSTGFHYSSKEKIKYRNKLRYVDNVIFADSSFFDVLDFEIKAGNYKKTLASPNQALITDDMASILFGESNPIGQVIMLGSKNIEITGVVAAPIATHLDFSLIVSYPTLSREFTSGFDALDSWSFILQGNCYVRLSPTRDLQSVEDGLHQIGQKFHQGSDKANYKYYLQPLKDIHFDKRYDNEVTSGVSKDYLVLLACVGLFILIIACINFINLNTAMSSKRAKEAGVRKTLGARKGQLINQFIIESLLLVLVSMSSALLISFLTLPYYNMFMEKELSLPLSEPLFWVGTFGLFVAVSLLAGWYPALMISRFKVVQALKSKHGSIKLKGVGLRKFLVSFQFVISQLMIFGTLIVFDQMKFIQEKDLGFEQDALITAPIFSSDSVELRKLRSLLLEHRDITAVSFGLGAPTSDNDLGTTIKFARNENLEEVSIRLKSVDNSYKETYGLRMIAGRWLTPSTKWRVGKEFIINESMLEKMGISDPAEAIGQTLHLGINEISGPIVGVVQDFHVRSLHQEIPSTVLMYFPQLYYEAGIKISSKNIQESLSAMESAWQHVYPEELFNYAFMDEFLRTLYDKEQKMLAIFNIFSAISIFIACLGLFGLIAFTIQQKMSEIGIRKVFGAKPAQLVWILSNHFVVLITIAAFVSFPIGFSLMNRWLEGFFYRITVNPLYFLFSLAVTLLIAVLSVGYKAYKAALTNPIKVLRESN